jgi:phosphatidate cytidylyltransferase
MSSQSHTTNGRSLVRSSIFTRVAASIVFIPCFIIITRRGGYHFLALVDIIIFIGMWEFYRMMESKGVRPYKVIGIASGLALSWYVFFRNGVYANLFLTLALLAIMTLELTRKGDSRAILHISTTMLGVIYVSFLASHMVMLRELPISTGLEYPMGASFVYLAFVVTWSCDTGAYFVGTLAGKHPLLPRVSKKKTWEGAAGGMMFAVAGALVAKYTFAGYLATWHAVVLGVTAGVIGQVGDLVESMIKRDADIKDTSETIPGHGGVLDRFDSLLFTAPLIYYFLKFAIFK